MKKKKRTFKNYKQRNSESYVKIQRKKVFIQKEKRKRIMNREMYKNKQRLHIKMIINKHRKRKRRKKTKTILK